MAAGVWAGTKEINAALIFGDCDLSFLLPFFIFLFPLRSILSKRRISD